MTFAAVLPNMYGKRALIKGGLFELGRPENGVCTYTIYIPNNIV